MDEERWDDGLWVGPRSLRVFLGANRFFVGWWLFILTAIALAFWIDVANLRFPFALPLAIVTGGAITLGAMFAFSRGWIREGD